MLSVIGEQAARHKHCSMLSTFTYDKPEFVFPVLAAAAAAAAAAAGMYQIHDTLQYHTTALMPLHSLSVL